MCHTADLTGSSYTLSTDAATAATSGGEVSKAGLSKCMSTSDVRPTSARRLNGNPWTRAPATRLVVLAVYGGGLTPVYLLGYRRMRD